MSISNAAWLPALAISTQSESVNFSIQPLIVATNQVGQFCYMHRLCQELGLLLRVKTNCDINTIRLPCLLC